MYAQSASAICTSLLFSIFLGLKEVVDILDNDIAYHTSVGCIILMILSLNVIFLIWSLKAIKTVSKDELTIDYILKSNRERDSMLSRKRTTLGGPTESSQSPLVTPSNQHMTTENLTTGSFGYDSKRSRGNNHSSLKYE